MMTVTSTIQRRKTRKVRVGSVWVGGDAPITVQTMTNTDTCDVVATEAQINRCVAAGADMVRISVPSMEAAAAFALLRPRVQVPLIADIHFDHRIALAVAAAGADCLRINPGNIGNDQKIREVVDCAKDRGISLRIGVNAGSLEKELQKKYGEPTGAALVESAMRHIDILDRMNFQEFKVSVKASNVFLTLDAYRLLSRQIEQPLHLGVTEAGVFRSGTVKSAVALGALLLEGIGDTLRISLAAPPEDEVKVGFDLLKALGLRSKGINFIACPSCSRQEFDVIKVMNSLEARLEAVTQAMDVAVIGCKVNGPGEAKEADIGICGASPRSLVYLGGEKSHLIDTDKIVDEVERQVRALIQQRQEQDALLIVRTASQ